MSPTGRAAASRLLLECDRLSKRFPGVLALDQVCFGLREGEIHALCGENGAGKSTLIKVLCGLWTHGTYEGEVRIEGRPAQFAGVDDAEAAGIAVIYQELALVPEMTVAENLFLGNEPTRSGATRSGATRSGATRSGATRSGATRSGATRSGATRSGRTRWGLIDWHRAYAEAQQLLERFGIDLDPTATVADLGVGQQQLVEIAKALSKDARILLLDEPTAALTESESELLLGILRRLRQHGVTCVYISHRLEELLTISDRITILRDGQSVATLDTAATGRDEIIQLMVGRAIGDLFPRQASAAGEVVLEVRGLSVTAPGHPRPILQEVSFRVCAGEILGIGGLMGSGRTELLMHLIGAYGQRSAGQVLLSGEAQATISPVQAIQRGMYLVSEDRKRYGAVLEQPIRFNLSLSTLRRLTHVGLIDGHAEVDACQGYFDRLGVKAPSLETAAGSLSGGNQQKVVLGKALMTRPRIVFLDEPTRGIDVGARREIYELMNRLTADGLAVVMVSSELPELMGMSDRLLILSAGRIGGAFEHSDVSQEDLMTAAMTYH